MLCQPKKPCFDCLIPYTMIPWNRDIFWDDYHTVKISYRYNPIQECVRPFLVFLALFWYSWFAQSVVWYIYSNIIFIFFPPLFFNRLRKCKILIQWHFWRIMLKSDLMTLDSLKSILLFCKDAKTIFSISSNIFNINRLYLNINIFIYEISIFSELI